MHDSSQKTYFNTSYVTPNVTISKESFNICNKLPNRNVNSSLPKGIPPQQLAQDINEFFTDKIKRSE